MLKGYFKKLWNKLHLQIIWYGREYSPARGLKIQKDIIFSTIGRKSLLKNISFLIYQDFYFPYYLYRF